MSRKTVYTMLKATGIPVAHIAWPEGSAPALPWCVYLLDNEDDLMADGKCYAKVYRWNVELYQKTADTSLEQKLEAAIESAFGPYSKYETWLDSENCQETVYGFTEIERI